MFFRKNKQKKSNFQKSVIPEHQDTKNIDIPSDNIKPESKNFKC